MRAHPFSIVLALALGACGDDAAPQPVDTTPDGAADTRSDTADAAGDTAGETESDSVDETIDDSAGVETTDTEVAEEVFVPPSTCSAQRLEDCIYRPDEEYSYTATRIDGLTYTDLVEQPRNVNIAIFRPTDAPTPAPVVVLSHGGLQGQTDPIRTMEQWAGWFASAGYVAVSIAHERREFETYVTLCQALEVQPGMPCGVKLAWDRQHDLERVLAWLEENAESEDFAGLFDLERIAYVGHDAGAGAVLMALGATRNFSCAQPFGDVSPLQDCQVEDLVSLPDERIDVGVALSPPGPGADGFMDQSYGNLRRPLMMATGAADGAAGEPASRLGLWPLLPVGGKHKIYVNDLGATNGFFQGALSTCYETSPKEVCDAARAGLFGAALAFVDANLLNDPRARQWLGSTDVSVGSKGVILHERK